MLEQSVDIDDLYGPNYQQEERVTPFPRMFGALPTMHQPLKMP